MNRITMAALIIFGAAITGYGTDTNQNTWIAMGVVCICVGVLWPFLDLLDMD